jgi:hypothetical protein
LTAGGDGGPGQERRRAKSAGGGHGHRGPDPDFHEGRQTRHHQGDWIVRLATAADLLDLNSDLFGAICIALFIFCCVF